MTPFHPWRMTLRWLTLKLGNLNMNSGSSRKVCISVFHWMWSISCSRASVNAVRCSIGRGSCAFARKLVSDVKVGARGRSNYYGLGVSIMWCAMDEADWNGLFSLGASCNSGFWSSLSLCSRYFCFVIFSVYGFKMGSRTYWLTSCEQQWACFWAGAASYLASSYITSDFGSFCFVAGFPLESPANNSF